MMKVKIKKIRMCTRKALMTDEDEEDVDRDEDVEEPVKFTLPLPETGATLFIRNIPFHATEDELRTLYVFYSLP